MLLKADPFKKYPKDTYLYLNGTYYDLFWQSTVPFFLLQYLCFNTLWWKWKVLLSLIKLNTTNTVKMSFNISETISNSIMKKLKMLVYKKEKLLR